MKKEALKVIQSWIFLGEERVQGKCGDLEKVRQPDAENKPVVTSEKQVEERAGVGVRDADH